MNILQSTIAALLLIASCFSNADWQLNNELSDLSLVTTKATHIAEVHHFKKLSGAAGEQGASVIIDLASIHTNIDIRDQRMGDMLFETAKFPNAAFTAAIDLKAVEGLEVGERLNQNITGTLSLHGASQNLDLGQVTITRLADNRLLVANQRPVLVNAASFNLVAGVEKLRQAAGLPSISNAVPVSFQLVFEKK
ncbi:YceI family protein [Porticoccus sp. W117]|uniref:YceI family protein n=1 Tax=Porticoccus sp. W117 TaxID=3054777 RepID=UPI0025952BB8|nr:YceI family protein [Porticoccus sp. W117]MDM3870824.1 YceI family protein [Porticoccus sp. W117]